MRSSNTRSKVSERKQLSSVKSMKNLETGTSSIDFDKQKEIIKMKV